MPSDFVKSGFRKLNDPVTVMWFWAHQAAQMSLLELHDPRYPWVVTWQDEICPGERGSWARIESFVEDGNDRLGAAGLAPLFRAVPLPWAEVE